MRRGGQSYFHLQDMLANVTSLTDSSGARVEGYTYSAFGKQGDPTSALDNPFTFAGRQWDAESSTYYNRARQLDPSSGRFTSEDPIQSANGYPYAGNDPISSRDPSGLFSISELNVTNSIRGELVSEQIGFGMNLVGAINGNGPSAKDAGIAAAGALAGLGVLKTVRTLKRVRAAKSGMGRIYPGEVDGLDDVVLRAQKGAGRYRHDGTVFRDDLNKRPEGYSYREWTVPTPGESGRGARRLIISDDGSLAFYTDNHYEDFVQVVL